MLILGSTLTSTSVFQKLVVFLLFVMFARISSAVLFPLTASKESTFDFVVLVFWITIVVEVELLKMMVLGSTGLVVFFTGTGMLNGLMSSSLSLMVLPVPSFGLVVTVSVTVVGVSTTVVVTSPFLIVTSVTLLGYGAPPPGIVLNQMVNTNRPEIIELLWNSR